MNISRFRPCLTIYPIRVKVMEGLSAIDIASLSISIGLEMTRYEKHRYLNPAKDVIDLTRPGVQSSVLTFVGKDLLKPVQILQAHCFSLERHPIEIRLLLLVGNRNSWDKAILLQCRTSITKAIEENFPCAIASIQPPNDRRDSCSIVIHSMRTMIYILSPEKTPADHCNLILYMEHHLLTAILDVSTVPGTTSFVDNHMVQKGHSAVFQDSFTIPCGLWQKQHCFYLLRIAGPYSAYEEALNVYLCTNSGKRFLRGPWGRWAARFRQCVTELHSSQQ